MKYPIHIIIDGADNTGKTTVCQMLGKKMNLPVVKMPNMKEYIEQHSTEEFSKLFNETIVQFKGSSFILDRGFTSSLAYSEVHHREFDLSYIKVIEEILQPKVFILTGRTDVGFQYFDIDEIFNYEQTEAVDKAFLKLAEEKKYEVIEVHEKNPSQIVHSIYQKL